MLLFLLQTATGAGRPLQRNKSLLLAKRSCLLSAMLIYENVSLDLSPQHSFADCALKPARRQWKYRDFISRRFCSQLQQVVESMVDMTKPEHWFAVTFHFLCDQ